MNTLDDRLDFVLVQERDFEQLFAWRVQPHVAQWWDVDGETTQEKFYAALREELALDWMRLFLFRLNERPIGFIQSYQAARAGDGWWPHEDAETRGLDLFIGEAALLGRGVGPRVVRAFATLLFCDVGVNSLITDPHPDNVRSVRCFEKAGFERCDRLQTPDGDALLLRLTRQRFTNLFL